MKVVITGATSFIAQHIINELLSHDHSVRGTVRNIDSADIANTPLENIELVEANLLEDDGWDKAFEGVDAVFHTASPVLMDVTEDELIGPAVEGTQRVLKAAAKAGVKRIVLTSSTAAIVNTDADVFTEAQWSEPDKCSPYPKSKTLAEKAAWDFIASLPEDDRPELVTCNPCVVFGPVLSNKVSSSLTIIQKLMERSMPAVPGIGFSIVDVRDVAIAHRLALETPEAAGNRYLLMSEFYWLKDIAHLLSDTFKAQGFKPPTMRIPYPILWLVAQFNPMAKSVLNDVGKQTILDASKAKTELGWQPRQVKNSIIESAQSMVDRKLIKP